MKSFDIKTMIHFGEGSLERLCRIPYKKVLVITNPFVASRGMIGLITKPLEDGGIQFEIFKDVVYFSFGHIWMEMIPMPDRKCMWPPAWPGLHLTPLHWG